MEPRRTPDSWNAQGNDTMADPSIVFQQLKTRINEPYLAPAAAIKVKD